MKRTLVSVAVSLNVIIFLPITLVGLLLPVNDYRAMDISDIPDCDGPLAIMLLIAPSLVVYAAGGGILRCATPEAEAKRVGGGADDYMRCDADRSRW